MGTCVTGVPKAGLPEGFVYIDERIEDCILDAKYWGTDNFLGRPVAGYAQPLVVMSAEAAHACVQAAELLRRQGYIMKLFDAYRPQRAVDDFIAWVGDFSDQRRKRIHYPNVNKADMFELGYLARRSGHSRGSSVDLSLVDAATWQELDMGSIFDFMDVRSHIITPGLTARQEQNRAILREAMTACGFETYSCEWWHFNLIAEPHPDTYFDFPIR